MLGWRLAISAVLIPAVFGLFWFDHQVGRPAGPLLLFCLFVAVRGAWELNDLLRVRSFETSFVRTAILSAIVVASGWVHVLLPPMKGVADQLAAMGPIAAAWAISLLVLFFAAALRYTEPGRTMETLGAELLVVSYVGGLLAVTAQLRWVAEPHFGYLVLGSLLIGTKGGDIGAYTLGRLFGKRKMVPRLSPGKTWAGAVGAVLFSSLGTWAFLRIATPMFDADTKPPSVVWSLIYGAVLGVVGLIGDLAESLIKRDVGKKDAAALLPGFGGLLDLIDSVIYAGPLAWVMWAMGEALRGQ
ncbi:MAG: phosphatidate cytidylyltransferase [Planctomycetaceae bacterium]|nr:phosphatidate cytidylyltransferase [Planctomycetaceae bacterium]